MKHVPNHDKVPFKDMAPEDRSVIVDAWLNGNAECVPGADGKWVPAGTALLHPEIPYRTMAKQLQIPWQHIKPEYKWAAMTAHMDIMLSSDAPIMGNEGYWWWQSGITSLADALNIDTTGIDWRDSLVQRPEGV